MIYNIKFSPIAQKDLQEIQTYISVTLSNSSASKRLIAKIKDAILNLTSFPEMGTPIETDGNASGYRYLVCKNYMIFYHIDNSNVKIDRILYGGRDYLRILFSTMQ